MRRLSDLFLFAAAVLTTVAALLVSIPFGVAVAGVWCFGVAILLEVRHGATRRRPPAD